MNSANDSLQSRVLRGLADCGFAFNAHDFTEEKQQADRRRTDQFIGWIKAAEKIAIPVIQSTLNVDLHHGGMGWGQRMSFSFDGPGFQEVLDGLSLHVDLACFRYTLSQPVVVGVIYEGVGLLAEDLVFESFDSGMDAFRAHTGTMAGIKMSVTGILLWCFARSSDSQTFALQRQAGLQRRHFWKKTNTVSWVVDLEAGRVIKHNGIPILLKSVFDTTQFEHSLHGMG
jgi:hypothetical protein